MSASMPIWQEEHRDEQVPDGRQLACGCARTGRSGRGPGRPRRRRRWGRAWRLSASSANPRVKARARATQRARSTGTPWRCPGTAAGASCSPTSVADHQEADGDRHDAQRPTAPTTEPWVTSRTTTVSTTRPITSSATAAPSTIRASVVAEGPQVAEDPGGDPHAGGGQGGADEQRRVEVVADAPPWPRGPGASARPRRSWRRCNEARPTLPSSPRSISMPDVEQEQDHADLAERAQHLVAAADQPEQATGRSGSRPRSRRPPPARRCARPARRPPWRRPARSGCRGGSG